MSVKPIIIIAMLLLIIPSIKAYDQEKAYDWLISNSENGSYNNIIDTSLTVLALSKTNKPELKEAISWLKSQENQAHCFPLQSCKIKDTSFALLALNEVGEDTSSIGSWLKSAQSSITDGNFLLQIVTSGTGNCIISYEKNNATIEKSIGIKKGRFPSCNNQSFLNLNTCLETNLLTTPSLILTVNCGELTSSTIISLLYNYNNLYHILSETNSYQAEFTVPNNCFSTSFKGDLCNYESSLYTNLYLSSINSELNSLFYLEKNYDSTNVLSNIILSKISDSNLYKNNLLEQQSNDNSFRGNIYNTALAVLSLKEFDENAAESAIVYLESKQKEDGSWNSNIADTALVLYALSYTPSEETEPVEIPEEDICIVDGECESDRGEDSNNCPEDCPSEEPDLINLCSNGMQDPETFEEGIDCGGLCTPCPFCNEDGFCDINDGETASQCQKDCWCEDTYCDSSENSVSCPQDCKKEISYTEPSDQGYPSSYREEEKQPEQKKTWLWFIIVAVLVIGAGIFLFIQKGKKQGKKPKYSLGTTTPSTRTKPYFFQKETPETEASKEEKVETELKKSMEEAKKFIKK